MIIKRWNGSAFVKEFPQTKAQLIRNNSDTANIFDSNDKILATYLPNSVFDSLYFLATVTGGSNNIGGLAVDALKDSLNVTARSPLGYYWVVNSAGSFTSTFGAVTRTLYTQTCTITSGSNIVTTSPDTFLFRVGMIVNGTGIPSNSTITALNANGTEFTISANATGSGTPSVTFAYSITTQFERGEESQTGGSLSSLTLEVGDWIVVGKVTGVGSIANPYVITFSTVNNTYELMTGANGATAGASGLVPAPAATDNVKYLTGAGTWDTPPGTYSHPTGGANSTITAANGLVLSAITVNSLGHVTSVSSKTLAAVDIPTLNQNTTGTASNVTGTVAIANGGTGATSQQAAINALAGAVTSGSYLRGNGTNISMSAIQAGDIPVLNQNTTGSAATLTTARTLTIGSTGKTFNGSADVSWNLTEIGAAATSHTHTVSAISDSTTVGQSVVKLTNPGAIRFIRINADNTVTALSDADFRSAIGAGTSSTTGTVTSVATTGSVNGITLTGGTITSSGTITLGGTLSNVANSALSNMAQNTIKGRITASTGAPEDLTASNVRSIIELAAPIYVQTTTPTATVTHSLWYDIN